MNPLDPKDILIEQAHNPELIFRLTPKSEESLEKLGIKAGSGVVARITAERGPAYASIYYEGNLYGASNLNTQEEKERCAAGRLHENYPTVARIGLPFDEAVKHFDFHIPERSLVPAPKPKAQRRHRYPHDDRGWQPN